jgi:hypothetical protein
LEGKADENHVNHVNHVTHPYPMDGRSDCRANHDIVRDNIGVHNLLPLTKPQTPLATERIYLLTFPVMPTHIWDGETQAARFNRQKLRIIFRHFWHFEANFL